MDCEKFDQHVMDALYDELDELTHAAMKRHMEGCARCASTLAGLKATRDAAVLPLEEPGDDLEDRILAAVEVAQRKTPWRRKALRALAWAGSHAMRPQLAMAALFVLVIGSSLLLLRARPGTVGVAPVRVTERGAPAPEQPEVALAPAPPAAAPAAAAEQPTEALAAAEPAAAGEVKRAEERAADKAGADEGKAKDEKADRDDGAPGGAAAALADAQAKKNASGCSAALPLFDEIGTRYPGTAAAHTAMWEAAQCYKASGNEARARELLLALRSVESYKAQVESELGEAQANAQNIQAPAKAAAATAAAGAAAAPAGKPAAASPARANAPNVYSKPKAADVPQAAPNAEAYSADPGAPTGQGLSAPMRRSSAAGF